MKNVFSFLLMALAFASYAQQNHNSNSRLSFEPALEPFYHGVASGDPLSDRVIIWTRVTTQTSGSVTVNWQMATDTAMQNIVNSGTTSTNVTKDFTVKVDVTGLQPSTYYYYQFEHDGKKSLIGRTKTAPTGDNDYLRFAIMSCNNYQNGYFNAFKHAAERNDLDAIIHLGDYIYEYAASSTPGAPGRTHEPQNEIITLDDYRGRYSHYRLDPDFRALHQQYPFICVWDDHESANNSWVDGAENHTPGTEGDWQDRKMFAAQANYEWLPSRIDPNNPLMIYRKLEFGDLLDLFMLETRLLERSEPLSGFLVNSNEPELWDPNRTMLGQTQKQWFENNLSNSSARWKVAGQQVMFTSLTIPPIPLLFPNEQIINPDQWNGYAYERQQIYNFVKNNNIENFVVLTGDIHTSWANDLPDSNYNVSTGANSRGVEFVATSITSSNSSFNVPSTLISQLESANPHIKYYELTKHGYIVLDVSKDKIQGDYYHISTITDRNFSMNVAASWYSNTGENFLRQASAPANSPVNPNNAPLAPTTLSTSVKDYNDVVIVGTFPNPFSDEFVVQFYAEKMAKAYLKLIDIAGKIVYSETYPETTKGINYVKVKTQNLKPGNYILMMQSGNDTYQRNVLKVN